MLFEEGLKYVPEQAALVEVAPHGLLQAILKRALPNCEHLALAQRGHPSPARLMLSALGRYSTTTRVRAGKRSTAGKKSTPISLVFELRASM